MWWEFTTEDGMSADLVARRAWYAQDLALRAPIRRNPAITEAFAAVPREKFLGPGPWRLMPDARPDMPFTTAPDTDPAWLYHDVLVTIDLSRNLNNGMPSFWAKNFDNLDLKRGQRVLQVGAGTGYYSAVLAEIVGPSGHVTAVEYDAELASKARDNLGDWHHVEVVAGDGRLHDAGDVDRIVVFAGATHPAPLWLDRLRSGGQLLMPLTAARWFGFLLLLTRPLTHETSLIALPDARDRERFEARSIGGVGIFPCAGGRDDEAAARLEKTLDQAAREAHNRLAPEIPIQALHRGEPPADAGDRVWYAAPGCWLERKATA
jgi:protein-L-isoaspartate(D-aspartate) O-methyltransferase